MSDKNRLPPGSDPDATISGPIVRPKDDPDATVSGPLVRPKDDPDATVSGPLVRPADDPEATVSGPLIRDPEQTITSRDVALVRGSAKAPEKAAPSSKADDPDATFSGPLTQFDPDATISSSGGSRRRNPFAPKALPEALQANLAALGGLNPLIAYANPVFSAVPQIMAARTHPDPALLKETLQDLIEAFEAGAGKSGASDATVEGAVYALCCLADDAAASTPWGKDWVGHGLLKEMRDESNGGEEFFSLLDELRKRPEENADLLEFLYICLALGFQGRYRNADGTGASPPELDRIRSDLHALITRRRGRPDGLSERWRPARAMPAEGSDRAEPIAWRKLAAPVFALLLLFVGYKISQRTTAPQAGSTPPAAGTASTAPDSSSTTPAATTPTTTTPTTTTPTTTTPTTSAPSTPAPAVSTPTASAPPVAAPSSPAAGSRQVLEKELGAELKDGVIRIEGDARVTISLADGRQFPPGGVEPAASVKAFAERVAGALDRTTGPILVRGYADNTPVKPTAFASNAELSAARAKAVAALIAAKLSQPQRLASEGMGEADPIAPNDTEEHRARNRRIVIVVEAGK